MTTPSPTAVAHTRALVAVLDAAGVAVRGIEARRGPRLAAYTVALDAADVDRVLRLGRTIAAALDVRGVRMVEGRGGVEVEALLDEAQWRRLPASACLPRPNDRALQVGIGLDARGRLVTFQFNDPTPHMGIWGGSRCGKSEAIRNIVWQMAMTHGYAELAFVLIDGKNRGLVPFASLPSLAAPIATTPEDGARLIAALVREVEARRDDPARVLVNPVLFVVVDEVAEFTGAAAEGLCRVAALGAELGVRLLVASQHPTVGAVRMLLTANLGARVVGKCNVDSAARLCMGGKSDAPRMLAGNGDMLLVTGSEDDARRVQCGMVTEAEWAMLPSGPRVNALEATRPEAVPIGGPEGCPDADVERVVELWRDGGGTPGLHRIRAALGCGDSRARRVRELAAAVVGGPGVPAMDGDPLTRAHVRATTGREAGR